MSKTFVLAADFSTGTGGAITNYLIGNVLGFRSWTADAQSARRFDTRSLAKRAVKEAGIGTRIEQIEVQS